MTARVGALKPGRSSLEMEIQQCKAVSIVQIVSYRSSGSILYRQADSECMAWSGGGDIRRVVVLYGLVGVLSSCFAQTFEIL
jgi:hypothetical protein